MGRELPLTRLHPDLLRQTRSWRRRLTEVEPGSWSIQWPWLRNRNKLEVPTIRLTVCYWKWPSRNSWFTHSTWWFSIVMLVSQRVPTILLRPMFQAYVSGLHFREYPHKIWSEIWYSTSILGSWNSHWSMDWLLPGLTNNNADFPWWFNDDS